MRSFRNIGVVGAGMMGSEIALVFSLAGYPTIISDQTRAATQQALDRLESITEKGVGRGFWSAEAAETARRNLSAVDGLEAHADRDLVIEAVSEDEELKCQVFAVLDAILGPSAGIASNTSSISITSLSTAVGEARRRRFLGAHFFSPVSRMRLVEVIATEDTDPLFADAVAATLTAIGKTPIRVKDVVGFAVNRLLHALVLESIRLVEEGVTSPHDIDLACKLGLGHAIGPFELLDNTKNSLSQRVHEILHQAYGERFLPRPLLRQMVAAGYDGRKAGRGWYRYDKAGNRRVEHTQTDFGN
jgi:3-hydroxybutyryl-CoA dehydrogenase